MSTPALGFQESPQETLTNTDAQAFGDLKPFASGRPKAAYIEPTDRCNSRCLHCPHYHHTFGADMSEAVMQKAFDAVVDAVEVIVAQGLGEPLITGPFYGWTRSNAGFGIARGFANSGQNALAKARGVFAHNSAITFRIHGSWSKASRMIDFGL